MGQQFPVTCGHDGYDIHAAISLVEGDVPVGGGLAGELKGALVAGDVGAKVGGSVTGNRGEGKDVGTFVSLIVGLDVGSSVSVPAIVIEATNSLPTSLASASSATAATWNTPSERRLVTENGTFPNGPRTKTP